MAVTTADLLAASLPPRLTFSPTNQSAAPTDDPGTPAAADFQNVLSSLQSTTPTTATTPATTASTPATTPATTATTPATTATADAGLSTTGTQLLPNNLLDSLLVEEDTTNTVTDPSSALGLLLAAVTATPVPTEVVPVDATTTSTLVEATANGTPNAVPTPPLPADVRSRADEIRLERSPNRAPGTTPLTTPQTTTPATPPVVATPVDLPAATTPPVPTAVAQPVIRTATTAITPGDAHRVAARTPSILAQAPVVVDPTQALPGGPPAAAAPPVLPPVSAAEPVQPTPPVTPGQPLSVAVELRANFSPPPAAPAPNPEAAAATPFAAVVQQQATATNSIPTAPTAIPIVTEPAPISTPQPLVNALSPAVAASTPDVQSAAVAAAVVEGRPSVETILATTVNAVPNAPVTSPLVAAPVRDPLPELTPVDSANALDLTATTSTPVAGLVPQAVDARPTPVASGATQPTAPAVQLADSIVTHASLTERDGKVEFQIRLDPAELGPVKIKLVAVGDRLTAEVVVSSDAVRQMVESQLPDLRQRLADAGLNVPTLEVSTGDQQQGGRGNDANEWEQAFGGFRQVASAGSSPRRPVARPATDGAGSLDVMV